MSHPKIVVVAGPNGSGKTTFAESFLVSLETPIFLNPDIIAAGISPGDFEKGSFQAGRVLLSEVKNRISAGESLSFESTLSGKTWYPILRDAKETGYQIEFFFLMLQKVSQNIERIKNRVSMGGHPIPTDTVRRRHSRVFSNFWNLYRPLADDWHIFDNSNSQPKRLLSLREFESQSQLDQGQFARRFLKGRVR